MAGLFDSPMMQLATGLLSSGQGTYGAFAPGLGQGLLAAQRLSDEQQQRELYRQNLALQNQRMQQQQTQERQQAQQRKRVEETLMPLLGAPPTGAKAATGLFATNPQQAAVAQAQIFSGAYDDAANTILGPAAAGPTAAMQNVQAMANPNLSPAEQAAWNRLYPGQKPPKPESTSLLWFPTKDEGKAVPGYYSQELGYPVVMEQTPEGGRSPTLWDPERYGPAMRSITATGTPEQAGFKPTAAAMTGMAQEQADQPVIEHLFSNIQSLVAEDPSSVGGIAETRQAAGTFLGQIADLTGSQKIRAAAELVKPENQVVVRQNARILGSRLKDFIIGETGRISDADRRIVDEAVAVIGTATDSREVTKALNNLQGLYRRHSAGRRELFNRLGGNSGALPPPPTGTEHLFEEP